jgi:20S proteasome subunit alpha 1
MRTALLRFDDVERGVLFLSLWRFNVLTGRMQLFKADPSGWYAGYRAAAIGQKGEEANNIFEKKLRAKPALPANEPIVTGLIALQSALGVDLKANEVEVGVCSKDAPRFRTLSETEVSCVLRLSFW